jgi:hypothetical protein
MYKNIFFRTSNQGSVSAGTVEKLKELFHSIGLASLCLSTGYLSPFDHWCKLRIYFI